MKKLIWLDDCRNPYENDWLNFSPIGKNVSVIWCKNFTEFVDELVDNGLPDGICFDHDLQDFYEINGEIKERTGYSCAKFLISYCEDHNLHLPIYSSHSANPVGRVNILKLLNNYGNFKK